MVNIFECCYQKCRITFSSVNGKLVLHLLLCGCLVRICNKKSEKGCEANLQSGECYVIGDVGQFKLLLSIINWMGRIRYCNNSNLRSNGIINSSGVELDKACAGFSTQMECCFCTGRTVGVQRFLHCARIFFHFHIFLMKIVDLDEMKQSCGLH